MYIEFAYCPKCGTRLEQRSIGGRERGTCPQCSFVQFPQVNLGVGAVVVDDQGSVLLLQRKHDPGKGRWTTPGGYVEIDEPFDLAAEREVKEETGLDCRVASLLAVRHRIDGADMYIAFRLTIEGGTLDYDEDESADCRFFRPDELETLPNLAPLSLELAMIGLADAAGFSYRTIPGYDTNWRFYGAPWQR